MDPISALLAIGNVIVPPVFDFVKKKFIKSENDTPERTMGSLAATKPEVLPQYTSSLATLLEAKVKFFNRDVVGQPSQWVVDLRAAIRPIATVIAIGALIMDGLAYYRLEAGARYAFITIAGNWLGSRLAKK
jgi:hypothetical protein